MMNLYRNTDGTWVGTKAEAEKGATKVDVPINPKSALIEFLNGLNEERGVSEVNTPDEQVTTPPNEPVSNDPRMTIEEQVQLAPLRVRLRWAVEAIDSSEEMLSKMSAALKARQ